jgi:hypothetical protein
MSNKNNGLKAIIIFFSCILGVAVVAVLWIVGLDLIMTPSSRPAVQTASTNENTPIITAVVTPAPTPANNAVIQETTPILPTTIDPPQNVHTETPSNNAPTQENISPPQTPQTPTPQTPTPQMPAQAIDGFNGINYFPVNNMRITFHYHDFNMTANNRTVWFVNGGVDSRGNEYFTQEDNFNSSDFFSRYTIIGGNIHTTVAVVEGAVGDRIIIHGNIELGVDKQHRTSTLGTFQFRYEHLDTFTVSQTGQVFHDVILQTYWIERIRGNRYGERYFARGIGIILERESDAEIREGQWRQRGRFDRGRYLASYEIN